MKSSFFSNFSDYLFTLDTIYLKKKIMTMKIKYVFENRHIISETGQMKLPLNPHKQVQSLHDRQMNQV